MTTQDLRAEQTVSTRIRKKSMNFPSFSPLGIVFGLATLFYGGYSCKNCGSKRVYELQEIEEVVVQDKQRFGKDVKPTLQEKATVLAYGCNRCGTEAEREKDIVKYEFNY